MKQQNPHTDVTENEMTEQNNRTDTVEESENALVSALNKMQNFIKKPLGKATIAISAIVAALIAVSLAAVNLVCFHEAWSDATCTDPKTCIECGMTEGEALGHDWQEATCTEPKTCSRCGETDGEPLGHTFGEWEVSVEATCTKAGEKIVTCSVCGTEIAEEIPMTEHKPGKWSVSKEPSIKPDGTVEDGVKVKECTVCSKELDSKTYTVSAKKIKGAYKKDCKEYSYSKISRNPDKYEGKKAKFTGEVVQAQESGGTYNLRVDVTGDRDIIYVVYTAKDGESRILEDDTVTLYGTLEGLHSYTAVLGNEITIPLMYAEYLER